MGNVFIACRSPDGTTSVTMGNVTITMSATMTRWPEFAAQAEVPTPKTQEIQDRIQHLRSRVGK